MSKQNHYNGRAGQLAVMAEFLIRGYNVAIPEVDVGDDIFVVSDISGEYSRVQVKTTLAKPTKYGYSARYFIRLTQLETQTFPETWYVFSNRVLDEWSSFFVISRQDLYKLYQVHELGSLSKRGIVSLYFSYSEDEVICSGQDLSQYLNNWTSWPLLSH